MCSARPEAVSALLRGRGADAGAAVVVALRERHERGVNNLHRALRGNADKFTALHLDLAQLHGTTGPPPCSQLLDSRDRTSERDRAPAPGTAGRVWNRYAKLSHALSEEESAALSADAAEVVVGAGRGTKAERVLMPPAPRALFVI